MPTRTLADHRDALIELKDWLEMLIEARSSATDPIDVSMPNAKIREWSESIGEAVSLYGLIVALSAPFDEPDQTG